nr:ClbS/DfsB family four-helix bundle protein [Enterococcus sp. 665A]
MILLELFKKNEGGGQVKEYESKEALIAEIEKTSSKYIEEFADINETDANKRIEGVDRTPYENLTYQLGWLALIDQWEQTELAGKPLELPAPGIKWNKMGPLHEQFYEVHRGQSLAELMGLFNQAVKDLITWINSLSDEELFQSGGRKWAQSTASNWPVWKWVHINTVAPFKSFRTKIRKWKKEL